MKELLPTAIAIYFAHLILLFDILPTWLILGAALAALWKAIRLRTGSPDIPRVLIALIGLMTFSFALLETPQFWHKDTATILVTIVCLMFMLDRSSYRQIMLVHASFFAMLVAILVAKGPPLPLFIYFLLTSMIFFSLMLHHLPLEARRSIWTISRNILLTALPVSAILLPLYYFFPDIKPNPIDFAVTGLSDTLEPGRVAALAQSDRLAFRVRFEPATQALLDSQMYWRASVLEESTGMSWHKGSDLHDEPVRPERKEAPLTYEMMLEPRLGNTLPLLEHTLYLMPKRKSEIGIYGNSQQRVYRSLWPLLEIGAMMVPSFIPRSPPHIPHPKIETSHRVRSWVEELKRAPVPERIARLLDHFRGYTYSLQPGTLNPSDPLDDFLFASQEGYCEHFAAAFASLLQMSGTPARVVTGFQGGTALGKGGFWQVLDRDAHAWTEIWVDDRWQRIDPTSVVPGHRKPPSERGSVALLPSAWIDYWARTLGASLRDLTQDIEVIWLLVFVFAGILLAAQCYRYLGRLRGSGVWSRELVQLLTLARQRGIERQTGETMGHFFKRLGENIPDEALRLDELSRLYNETHYGPSRSSELDKRLRVSLKETYKNLRRYN